MTKLNVVNEAIEYIPKKTKEGNPVTVRVPLNDKAKEILAYELTNLVHGEEETIAVHIRTKVQ